MSSSDLKWLTLKTVFLTLLASGARRSEVHALDYAGFQRDEQWRFVILKPHNGFVSKTQLRASGSSILNSFKIPALIPSLSASLQEERTLCPVRALKIYLARTQDRRQGKKLLFVAHKKSHNSDICKNTLSGWVRTLLLKCYEDAPDDILSLQNTKTHEIRALAASLAFRGNLDLEEIMQACSWKSHSTFSSFYLRDVSVLQSHMLVLGPIVAAQSVVHPPS